MNHPTHSDRRPQVAVPASPNSSKALQPATADQPSRDAHRSFDYGAGYGHRSGFSGGLRYADVPNRPLFHCG